MQNIIFGIFILIVSYLIFQAGVYRKEVQKEQKKIREKLEALKRTIEEIKPIINDEVDI
jgi:hypothetical protein